MIVKVSNDGLLRLLKPFIIEGLTSAHPFSDGEWTPDEAFDRICQWVKGDNFALFVLFSADYRPRAFITVEIHDTGFNSRIAVAWIGYSTKSGAMREMANVVTMWAKERGAKAGVVVTSREDKPYVRLMERLGFSKANVIYRKEL